MSTSGTARVTARVACVQTLHYGAQGMPQLPSLHKTTTVVSFLPALF